MNKLHLLMGLIKAQGLLALDVQRILQHHCETGKVAEVASLVAAALLENGLEKTNVRMPVARGLLTDELREEAWDAAKYLAEQYSKRGVLCAKGFFPSAQLMKLLFAAWEATFGSVLRNPEEPGIAVDHLHPDFIARSAVSAQELARMLLKLERSAEGDIILPMKDLEGLCVRATQEMYRAFTQPDAAIHRVLHGED